MAVEGCPCLLLAQQFVLCVSCFHMHRLLPCCCRRCRVVRLQLQLQLTAWAATVL